MSSVPTSRPLPSEFTHPALQDLLRAGTTRGSVNAEAVRQACEEADVPMPRVKAVLRGLDDAGVVVEVPAMADPPRRRAAVPARFSRACMLSCRRKVVRVVGSVSPASSP